MAVPFKSSARDRFDEGFRFAYSRCRVLNLLMIRVFKLFELDGACAAGAGL